MAGTQLIERKQNMNCQLWQNLLNCFYWWTRAKNSSFYFRALIFCEEKKDLIAIGNFYFNTALISQTICSVQQVTSFQIPKGPLLFPENQLKSIK
jgi:hypothetical protein